MKCTARFVSLFVFLVIINVSVHADTTANNIDLNWIGQVAGPVGDYVLKDGYAYIAEGPYLTIYDLHLGNANDQMVSRTLVSDGPSDFCWKLLVDTDHVFMAYGEKGVAIIDLTDRSTPKVMKWLKTPGTPKGIAVKGSILAVAAYQMSLQLYDITDLKNPVPLGAAYLPMVIQEVAMVENFALVKGKLGDMTVIDISDPSHPVTVGQHPVPNVIDGYPPYDSFVTSGSLVMIGYGRNGFQIMDLKKPLAENPVGSTTAAWVDEIIEIIGNYAVTMYSSNMTVLDLSDPTQPQVTDWATMLAATGGNLPDGRFSMLREKNNNPVVQTTFDAKGDSENNIIIDRKSSFGVIRADDFVYVSSTEGVSILDVYAPEAPRLISKVPLTGQYIYEMNQIELGNDYLFLLRDEIDWYDVSDPHQPVTMEPYALNYRDGAALAYVDGAIYAGTKTSGIWRLQPSGSSLAKTGSYDTGAAIIDLMGWRRMLFAVDENQVLSILQWSDTDGMELLGSLELPSACLQMSAYGSDLYMACGEAGVLVVDIDDPTHPVLKVTQTGINAQGIGVDDRWIATYESKTISLYKRSASNDFTLNTQTTVQSGGNITALTLRGDYVYATQTHYDNVSFQILHLPASVDPNPTPTPTPVPPTEPATLDQRWGADRRLYPAARLPIGPSDDRINQSCLAVDGARVYTSHPDTGVQGWQIDKATTPTQWFNVEDTGVRSVVPHGSHLYVGYSGAGGDVYNLADPGHPLLLGRNTAQRSQPIFIHDDVAFVNYYAQSLYDDSFTFRLMDYVDPLNPTKLCASTPILEVDDIVFNDRYCVVLEYENQLRRGKLSVVNYENPYQPEVVSTLTYEGDYISGMVIDGPNVYLGAGSEGLRTFVLDDDGKLWPSGWWSLPGEVHDLRVDGSILWVAAGSAGLLALDLSGQVPLLVAQWDPPQEILLVDWTPGAILAVDDTNMLWILNSLVKDPFQILSPSGEQLYSGGDEVSVNWLADPLNVGTAIHIELWSDSHVADLGIFWAPDMPATSPITLPLVPERSDYHLRLISVWDPSYWIESDPMSIIGGPLRIDEPAAQSTWTIGQKQPIRWRCNPEFAGTSVAFSLWNDESQVADLAVDTTTGEDGELQVDVPDLAKGNYLLRATSIWDDRYTTIVPIRLLPFGEDQSNGIESQIWDLYR